MTYHAKLIEGGKHVQAAFDGLEISVESFDEDRATATAMLRAETGQLGLSFGDRACLVRGRHLRCPVYTADRIWGDLAIGLDIVVIR